MLSDLDPLLPSSSNLFHLDLQAKLTPNKNPVSDLQLENNVITSLEEIASSQSSVIFESEPNLDNMESRSPATVSDDKGDQSSEDTLKAIRPTSKEFKKTWGFRRTTIAKREGTGDAEMEATAHIQQQQMQQVHQQLQQLKEQQSAPNQSLRRSGRQPKRTERVEEFMTAVRRNRIRRSAPAALEDTSETSCPVTDVETASEGSVESMAEVKSESHRHDVVDIEEPMMVADLKGEDDSSSDSDALTLKELQNRLRKRQTGKVTAETVVVQAGRPIKDEPPTFEVERPPVTPYELKQSIGGLKLPIVKVELTAIKVEPPATPEPEPICEDSVALESTEAIQIKQEITDSPKSVESKDHETEKVPPKPKPSLDASDAGVLYCICRQPHNKRFMICCDRCEDWFHGECVGISEARGQLFEQNEEDYICPNCMLLPVKEEPLPESDQDELSDISGQNSYDKGIKGRIEKASNPHKKKKLKIFQPVTDAPVVPKCIGPGCSTLAQPDSVYCSHDCILKHAAAAMKFISAGRESKSKDKLKTKPEKVTPPKPPPLAAAKSVSGQKRPAPEKRMIKMKKMLVMVSKMDAFPVNPLSEPVGESSAPSWESDHNYNAVNPGMTAPDGPPAASAPPAAITSSVFYKSAKEEDSKPVEPVSLPQNTAAPTVPSMKKRIAALPRIPMLKRHLLSEPAPSQTPVRPSPLSSNNLPIKSPLTASSLAPSRNVPAPKQMAPSSMVSTPAAKRIMSPNIVGGVIKTECASGYSSSAGTVQKAEGPAAVSSAGASKNAEDPAGAGKKAECPSAPTDSTGVPNKMEVPSTSNASVKPTTNPSHPQPNLQMRLNIRRSLKEILWKRVGDSDDLFMAENEVAKVAMNIEKEMFGLFRETDSRYKSKYRNLMLNLKDPKNQGLFHRVLSEELSLSKLVRLKPEELISKRLSSWKSRPTKPTLDSKTKTHVEQRESDTRHAFPDMEDSPPLSDSDDQEPPQESAKTAAPEKSRPVLPDIFSSMLNDTTSQHRAHLFDLNCKICTGQMSVSEDDVAPRRHKTLAPSKKTELRTKTESSTSTVAAHSTPDGSETAENVSSSNDTGSQPKVEKVSLPQGSTSTESSLPRHGPFYPDTSAAGVRTTVTVSGRDPRTALNRPPATVTPAPDPSSSPARDKAAVEETKSEMPKQISTTFAAPKSILMKPSSSLDPRYLASSSLNLNISASRSPQDGDTSLFLSRLGTIWKGFINMQSVAKFVTKAYPVSGSIDYLDEDLPDTIHIGGRISPKTVWDYVGKLKSSVSKELCLIRFHPATEEEEVAYISLYSYFSSRGRFGVVANNNRHIKDLYLIPLSAKDPIPSKLLPFDGPGLESSRPNLLLGLVICQKGKRPATILESEKTEEKRSKFQIQEEADIIYSKVSISSQHEKKILKYQPFSKEPAIVATPPRSPKSPPPPPPPPPPPEPPTVSAPKLFSSLPTFKNEPASNPVATAPVNVTTTAPSIQTSFATESIATSSTATSTTKSSTPLEHILKTLFGKKKPFESESSSSVIPQTPADEKMRPGPMIDPIVRQFEQTSKKAALEDLGDDRPYDPEEEYDPEKDIAMDVTTDTESTQKKSVPPCETLQRLDEAYDPEDETIFEEAKVVVDDFPNRIQSEVVKSNVEVPGEYLSAITAASSLVEQQKMLEELNKQIEEQKRQLEAQEEALRQQRAAVGVSMAHFSVSDALMSPPPKPSLTKTELFQQEEQSELRTDEALRSDLLLPVTTQKTDSTHTLTFWQAASRLLREANESSNYQVSRERKSESPATEKPLVTNECKEDVPSLSESKKDLSTTIQPMQSDDYKLVPGKEVSSSEKDIKVRVSEKSENSIPQLKSPAVLEEMPVSKSEGQAGLPVTALQTLQPKLPSLSLKEHISSDSHNPTLQKDSKDVTLQEKPSVQCTNTVMPLDKSSDRFGVEQKLGSAHKEEKRNSSSTQFVDKTNSLSLQADGKRESPPQQFQETRTIPPYTYVVPKEVPPRQTFTGLNPPLPMFGVPFNIPEYRGPAPQSFSESSPSDHEQHRPSLDQSVGQKSAVPMLFSGQYGQVSRYGDRGSSISHQRDEKVASPSQMEEHSGPHLELQEPHSEQKNKVSSQFEGPRGLGASQFMGNTVPPPFPFDGPTRPPPSHYIAHRGNPMHHQFAGMRGPAPNSFTDARGPNPNEFPEKSDPIASHISEQRGPSSNQFEDQRNIQTSFTDQRGDSKRMFMGRKGPRVSRFSEPHEPPPSRFNYKEPSPQNTPSSRFTHQEQSPQSVKSSPRPLLELPNYSPQQNNEAWQQGSTADSHLNIEQGQRSPNEFREGKEPDQRIQSFDCRQREREGYNKDNVIDQPQAHPDRQSRRFERRGGRGPRGSWSRGNSRHWNRERDGERYRDGERPRDGERYREGERNRDWDRHREPNREWDKSKDRDLDKNKEMERSRDRPRHRDRERDSNKRRDRERSRSKDRDRNRDVDREERDRFRDYNRDRIRDRDWDRTRERDRDREKERDRDGEREWSRDSDRERDRFRGKDHKDRSTSKESSRDFKLEEQKEPLKQIETQASSLIHQT